MEHTREDMVAMFGRVKTGTLQDGLDMLGLFDQSLSPAFRMVSPPKGGTGFIGIAKLLRYYKLDTPIVNPPFERSVKFWKYLESYIEPGDVVVAGFDGEIPNCELTGGMLGTLYARRGAVGWVGTYVRDLGELDEIAVGFVAMGCHPAIARGRVGLKQSDDPLVLGGVTIHAGDYVAGDSDGAVVIPGRDGIPEKMYAFVEDYVEREHKAQDDIKAGKLAMSDIIDKYRIL